MAAPTQAKRPRLDDDALVVPKDVVARIRQSLAAPARPGSGSEPSCYRFSILSWNIDGIDETGDRDRMLRCLAVAEHIAKTQPAIVLLQEVIPPQLELLLAPQLLGEHYDVVCPENPRMAYYCAMLLHKRQAQALAPPTTRHFASSQMGRHFLAVDVVVDRQVGAPLTVITTHLESTKSERAERIKQLTEILIAAADYAASRPHTVLFAGDVNARDEEVVAARKVARAKRPGVDNIVDAWVWCGSQKMNEFTWDTSVNTNLGCQFSSRCRFDRCYFSSPHVTDGQGAIRGKSLQRSSDEQHQQQASHWVASSFELVGRSKVEGLGRFPSDHWGIQVTWALPASSSQTSTAESPIGEPSNAGGGRSSEAATVSDKNLSGGVDSTLSEQERRQRRELAAARAEKRLDMLSNRGTCNMKKQSITSPPLAPKPETAVRDATCEEESEERILAQAIALSLQETSSGSEKKSAISSDGSRTAPAEAGSVFEHLTVSCTASNQPAIDLDPD